MDFRPWRLALKPVSIGFMTTTELHEDMDGYVVCPRRGCISVEWCEGCPDRVGTEHRGGRAVVVCTAEAGDGADRRGSSPLRDLPEIWT